MQSRFALPLIISFVSLCASAQQHVRITATVKPAPDNITLSVYKPVAGVFNSTLPDKSGEAVIRKGSFTLNVSHEKSGFIRLQGKDLPRALFYAEPGDEIGLVFVPDQTGKFKVTYSGNNASANNLLATSSPLNNMDFLQKGLPAMFKSVSAVDLMSKLEAAIAKDTRPLIKMLDKGKITKDCYDAIIRDTEQSGVNWVNTYLKDFQMPDHELPYVTGLNRDEVTKLARLLYVKYDPYDGRYASATTTYNNQRIKSILIEDGVLERGKNSTPTWAQFASDFNMTASRLSAIDFAPDTVQMNFIGTSMLSAIAFKAMNDARLYEVFGVYKSRYPNSPFNTVIAAHVDTTITPTSVKIIEEEPEPAKVFLIHESSAMAGPGVKKIADVKNIQELIKEHFNGRAVFVDFWATWCAPCIAEFKHEHALRDFLNKQNISMLYVSIDKDDAAVKWRSAIDKHQLSGYHYLVSDEVGDAISKWFAAIPRYMLFDASGKLVDDNLPKPGSKEELYRRIVDVLGK